MTTECRECTECYDQTHHWIDNADFGNDPNEAETDPRATHCCKHCPEVGFECRACNGGHCLGEVCIVCKGEGVIPLSEHLIVSRAVDLAAESICTNWDLWEAHAGHQSQIYQTPEAGDALMLARIHAVVEAAIYAVLRERE